MWWEIPAMVFIESVGRLVSWVIKEKVSYEDESYSPEKWMRNIEYPQYTIPKEIYWYKVPDILLSWHHKKIEEWRKNNERKI